MTEKQKVLAQLKEDLGVKQVNYLDDDTIEFGYNGYSIHVHLKKMRLIREKPDVKKEIKKQSTVHRRKISF